MTTTETAIRIALTLAGHPESDHGKLAEATLYGLQFADALLVAQVKLLELEGDSGIPLNMRGAGSQP